MPECLLLQIRRWEMLKNLKQIVNICTGNCFTGDRTTDEGQNFVEIYRISLKMKIFNL